jgi:hypothetical protein
MEGLNEMEPDAAFLGSEIENKKAIGRGGDHLSIDARRVRIEDCVDH